MTKIRSRPSSNSSIEDYHARLQSILFQVADGQTGSLDTQQLSIDSLDDGLSLVHGALLHYRDITRQLYIDLNDVCKDAAGLSGRLDEAMDILDGFMTIEFDSALDESTEELMLSLCAAGVAETTADGELAWDSRIVTSKADLKPVLREAIARWVEKRLS